MGDSRQENAIDLQHAVEELDERKKKIGRSPSQELASASPPGIGDVSAGSIAQDPAGGFVAIEIQSLSTNPPDPPPPPPPPPPPKGAFEEHEKNQSPQHRGGGDEEDARICRVCHLSLGGHRSSDHEEDPDKDDDPVDEGIASRPIELGCACKDDLAFAHRRCAETWFKIKGNRNCEICGELAHNVAACVDDSSCGRHSDEQSDTIFEQGMHPGDRNRPRSFWQHRPICNFVLAFIVVILLLPWLFRIRLF